MAKRETGSIPKSNGNWDEEHIENWGVYQCVNCGVLKWVPVFMYPPSDMKGHCTECEGQTERVRIDE